MQVKRDANDTTIVELKINARSCQLAAAPTNASDAVVSARTTRRQPRDTTKPCVCNLFRKLFLKDRATSARVAGVKSLDKQTRADTCDVWICFNMLRVVQAKRFERVDAGSVHLCQSTLLVLVQQTSLNRFEPLRTGSNRIEGVLKKRLLIVCLEAKQGTDFRLPRLDAASARMLGFMTSLMHASLDPDGRHVLSAKFQTCYYHQYKTEFEEEYNRMGRRLYIQLSWTRCEVVTTSGLSRWAVRDDVTPVAELGLHAFTPLLTRPKL
ncbi:hypothetical protein HW555_003663 [Spodoptera exigua]|uniref:Uncharacterized protein n=1 Tax=Spodoptera exigua TaxID=7107 RepID=A0A835L895_SPOEX|nr:hypothetical protein HW555_003663 [Spodoptera exigua]